MQLETLQKLNDNPKIHAFLLDNSPWYKYLNRDKDNYNEFIKAMKDKYGLKTTDRISKTIDNIDMINSVLKVLK